MRRAVVAELRRRTFDRSVRACLLLLVGATAAMSLLAGLSSTRDLDAARRRAADLADTTRLQLTSAIAERCGPTAAAPLDPTLCDQMRAQLPSIQPTSFYSDPRFAAAVETRPRLQDVGAVLAAVVAVLGCLVGGADWANGSVVTSLLSDPRRLRLLVAKTAAMAAVAIAVVGGAVVVLVAGDLLVSATRGNVDGLTPSFLVGTLGPTVARVFSVGVVLAVLGHSVGWALRSPVAALLTALGYLAVIELGLRNAVKWSREWLLFTNIDAAVSGSLRFFVADGGRYIEHVVTSGRAAALLSAVAAVALVWASSATAWRDI